LGAKAEFKNMQFCQKRNTVGAKEGVVVEEITVIKMKQSSLY
jgi:hypothetical protein